MLDPRFILLSYVYGYIRFLLSSDSGARTLHSTARVDPFIDLFIAAAAGRFCHMSPPPTRIHSFFRGEQYSLF